MFVESFRTHLPAFRSPAVARGGLVVMWCVLTASAGAQGGAPAAQPSPEVGAPVIYRGQEIVRIYGGVGGLGPAERARLWSERLNQLVRDLDFDPTRATVNDRETHSEFVYDDRVLGIITDDDAKAVGRLRAEFAREVRERLVVVITSTREEFSAASIVIGLAWAALATILLAVLVWLVVRVSQRAEAQAGVWLQPLSSIDRDGFRTTRLGSLVHRTVVVLTAVVAVALVAVWVQVILQVLPWSRPLARAIYRYASAPILTLWFGLLGIVPNLFYLAVIAIITFLVLRVVRVVFNEIAVGNVRLASFPDDWAEPTYKLVRVLLLAVAVVGAFPYIPGSRSPAFQGISLFLGLLVSFSSSSSLSNVIAGIILTYTRAFRLGDIVRIGETFGEVTVKRLLVTNVRTYKNVVVSIPNSLILTTQVLNYTTLAAERGLVLHTSVTIGYDVPWKKVHELLIAAALRTPGVLEEPRPFVLQKALNDFSVEYEINAFVGLAKPMPDTYSALHACIQECFNEAGVEIMSPNYLALRDGNQVTTPRPHLQSDYAAPAFRVRRVDEASEGMRNS
jgi:small-conductance mechanosensitive channel